MSGKDEESGDYNSMDKFRVVKNWIIIVCLAMTPGSNGGANKAANSKKTNVINKNVSAKGTNHGNIQQKAKEIIQPALNRAAAN